MPARAGKKRPSGRGAGGDSPSEKTREYLVLATERIIAEDGRAAVTTTRVSEVAGFSVGVLYDHFRNRNELLAAVEHRSAEIVVPAILAKLRVPPPIRSEVASVIADIVHAAVDALVPRVKFHATNLIDARTYALIIDAFMPTVDALADFFCLEDPRFAVTLAVKVVGTSIWFGAHEHPREVASGRLKKELVALVTQYLLRNARGSVAPPS
jgi:AcrR family transcriptional regulator